MIDTWFFAACCFLLLMLAALFRVARSKSRYDRYVAALVAITIGSAAGLTFSIAMGTLLVLDITIILALLGLAGTIAVAKSSGGAGA